MSVSGIHTEHVNVLRGENVVLFNVKPGGTYSNQWTFKLSGTAHCYVTGWAASV
jgi:hypothetical protein